MAKRLVINPKCPFCREMVHFPTKKGAKRENAEYIHTKRGVNQLFHTSCYRSMIENHGDWYEYRVAK